MERLIDGLITILSNAGTDLYHDVRRGEEPNQISISTEDGDLILIVQDAGGEVG